MSDHAKQTGSKEKPAEAAPASKEKPAESASASKEKKAGSRQHARARQEGKAMLDAEQEISRIESLFTQLTGQSPQSRESPYAPIPPEADAEQYVRENLQRLYSSMQNLGTPSQQPRGAEQQPAVTPRMNVSEGDEEWVCQVELPGIDRTNVSVETFDGNLRVSAVRQLPFGDGERAVHVEVTPCRCERIIPLPRNVKPDTANARLENGLLTIRFDKEPAASRREVSISSA